ncbi:hypothetical protein Taro_027656 [Colocasia esculenta]|uniref:Uncharacterized protein n=1 Tax=Colocasia esculenta TaxID=4460 RepID=A0A843V994_COLES|nr:hypothetical protein [Colocasia esculenta]
MQGLVQAMQTQAHTQAALQAQLEALAQVPAQDHGVLALYVRQQDPETPGASKSSHWGDVPNGQQAFTSPLRGSPNPSPLSQTPSAPERVLLTLCKRRENPSFCEKNLNLEILNPATEGFFRRSTAARRESGPWGRLPQHWTEACID